MCGPAAVPIMMAVSTAFAAKSAIDQGKFAKGTAAYNARVAENEAQKTQSAGNEAENIQRRKTAELLSKQKAQLGAANIDLTSGSALNLQEDTLALGEADALRIRSNTAGRVGALNTSADLTRAQGSYAETAGYNQAAGTVLSGTASIAGTGVSDKWFTPTSAANDISFITPNTTLKLS